VERERMLGGDADEQDLSAELEFSVKPNPAFVVDPGTRRVTTGRNGERWTRAILPVSAHDINASVRANI